MKPRFLGNSCVDVAGLYQDDRNGRGGSGSSPTLPASAANGWYARYGKRVFDLVVALISLVALSPIILLAALVVLAGDGAPVIYRQARSGIHLRSFVIAKFRTMLRDAEHRPGAWKKSDPRAGSQPVAENEESEKDTRLFRGAAFLRRYSIDELPQLWNVVCGDMSIVGPRPLMCVQVEENWDALGDVLRARAHVRPGITGLWQVSGRSNLTFEHMMTLDLEYVQNLSFFGDLKILLRTIGVVLRASGAV